MHLVSGSSRKLVLVMIVVAEKILDPEYRKISFHFGVMRTHGWSVLASEEGQNFGSEGLKWSAAARLSGAIC